MGTKITRLTPDPVAVKRKIRNTMPLYVYEPILWKPQNYKLQNLSEDELYHLNSSVIVKDFQCVAESSSRLHLQAEGLHRRVLGSINGELTPVLQLPLQTVPEEGALPNALCKKKPSRHQKQKKDARRVDVTAGASSGGTAKFSAGTWPRPQLPRVLCHRACVALFFVVFNPKRHDYAIITLPLCLLIFTRLVIVLFFLFISLFFMSDLPSGMVFSFLGCLIWHHL